MVKKSCTLVMMIVFVVGIAGGALGDVPVDEEHFPDAVFRAYVLRNFDRDGDGILSDLEIGIARTVDLSSQMYDENLGYNYLKIQYVTSLEGIEYLPALTSLTCNYSGLEYLDVSQNTALVSLYCKGNRLTMLNLTNCASLETLECDDNLLSSLNVSSCTALKRLSCSNNQLYALNLSSNLALEYLDCSYNRIAEMDVSNNSALTECTSYWFNENGYAKFYSRSFVGRVDIYGLTVRHGKMSDYQSGYYIDLNDYVPDAASSVKSVRAAELGSYPKVNDAGLVWIGDRNDTYNYESSNYTTIKNLIANNEEITVDFGYANPTPVNRDDVANRLSIRLTSGKPKEYTDNLPEAPSLDVQIDVIEGGANADKIICGIESGHYLDKDGNPLTEASIAEYSYGDCGKFGFAADGNSRLIIRVKSNKPGEAFFSFDGDSNVTLEKLTTRTAINSRGAIAAEEISEGVYQASAVLVAPDGFPAGKEFPSDTFTVNVVFTTDTWKADEKDIQTGKNYRMHDIPPLRYIAASSKTLKLKIAATPVLLIPGMFDNAAKTFGINDNTGIWYSLRFNDFDANHIDIWDYDGSKGPNELLAGNNNELFGKIAGMLGQYASEGIVCTKVDVVTHGVGGLMARKFLHEEGKESNDGNNWTVRSYRQGMVRRLITISAPHEGTPWADGPDRGGFINTMYNAILTSPFYTSHPHWESLLKPFTLMVHTMFPSPQIFKDAYVSNGSIWSELKTTTPRTYGYPAGVPMYAIYGNIIPDGVLNDSWFVFKKLVDVTTGFNVDLIDISDIPSMLMAHIERLLSSSANPFAQYFGRVMGGMSVIYDAPSYMRLLVDAIARRLFGAEANDLIVSASSASHRLNSKEFTNSGLEVFSSNNERYAHWSICQQVNVGDWVTDLLLGRRGSFTVFSEELYEDAGSVVSNVSDFPDDITSADELEFTETLGLKVTPSIITTGGDTQAVKITVTARNPVESDVYCTFGNAEHFRLFKMPYSDGNRTKFAAEFNAAEIFESMDAGVIEVVCMSFMSDDAGMRGVRTSNAVKMGWMTDNVSEDEGIEYEPDASTKPAITSETLPNAATGQAYTFRLTATGTTPITWSLKSGKLTAGLTLSESGLISGTPTKAGKSTFTVKAANAIGDDTQAFTLQVFDPVSITTASLKDATIGKSYSVTLKAKGSKTITWSATGLPNGLTMNEKGKVSGKPTVHGTFSVKVTGTNGAGRTEKTLQLTVKGIAPKLSGSLAKATLGKPYSSGLKLSAGSEPVTWSIAGTLPDGLTLDSTTGIISGTPTSYAKSGYKLTITATNDAGSKSKSIKLTVKGTAPKITVKKLPDATAGTPYTATLTATGSEPITWKAEGLPDGLTLDGDTITGTPTEAAGKIAVALYAENPVKSVKKNFTLKVNLPKENSLSQNKTHTSFQHPEVHDYTAQNQQGRYVIVAEIGTVSCDVAGLYDFTIDLNLHAQEGEELVYFADSDKPSDDDEIADFWDSDGAPISAVPSDKRITISVWLNPETVYNPVIAVKR